LNKPYPIINFIFAGIVLLIMGYSGFFSGKKEHPVKCFYEQTYNKKCPSCGMSRSFSEIVRLNFSKANEYNANAIYLFSFFFIQFFLRLLATLLYHKAVINPKILITGDIIISIGLFIYCFYHLPLSFYH